MAMGLFQILKQAFTAVPTFDDLNDEFYDSLEEADVLYGITMQERGVSTVLTANLNELSKEMKIK